MIIGMDEQTAQLAEQHEVKAVKAREFLAHEYEELISSLKGQASFEPTAGILAVLVSALKAYGELFQVKQAPGERGKITEVQAAKMLAAERERTRAEVLEEVKASREAMLGAAQAGVRESLIALSEKSLG